MLRLFIRLSISRPFKFQPHKEDFYLTASRMVPYKKMPLIVEAFASMSDKRLVVIGDDCEFKKCKRDWWSNITLLGWQSFSVLKKILYAACRRLSFFASEEDFGITPLREAQACGASTVIAFGKGAVFYGNCSGGWMQSRLACFLTSKRQTPSSLRLRALRVRGVP